MKKPFRALGSEGFGDPHRDAALSPASTFRAGGRIRRYPMESPDMAAPVRVRETRRVMGPFDWLHPFRHHVFASVIVGWQRWRDSNPRCRGFGDRRSAAELHLFRKPPKTKKPPRSIPGGLPIWGLSSVVSRHRQAHLAAREGTIIHAPRPMAAAVFGKRWNVHHDHHGGELLRASPRKVNRNQRYRQVYGPAYAAAAISPLIRSPSLLALTRTVPPSLMRPARIWPASGFCSSRWITRFSGRAP